MRNGISNLRVSKIVVYIPYLALAWTPPPGAAGAGTANFEIVATERGGGSEADDDDDDSRVGGSEADDDDDDDDDSRGGGGGVRGFDIDIYDSPILINTIILYLSVIPLYPIISHYNRSTLHNNASPGAKNHLCPFTRFELNARNKNS